MTLLRLSQLFLFTLPIQVALNPTEGVDLPFSKVFSVFLVLFWIISGFWKRDVFIPVRKETFFLFSFLFLASVSFLWAENPALAVRRATFLLSFIPLFLVFSSIIRKYGKEGREKLVSSFVFGATIAAIVGIGEFLLQFLIGVGPAFHFWVERVLPVFLGASFSGAVLVFPSLLVNIGGETVLRASAFFPDPHMFAFYMGLSIPLSIGLGILSPSKAKRKMFFLLGFLLFSADLLSFSRGGYVGLLAGGLTAFLLFSSSFGTRKKLFLIAVFTSLFLAAFSADTPFRDRLLSSFSLSEGSNEGRIALWKEGVGKIMERPILGYGLGNYPLAVKPTAEYREPIYIHDLPLDIASETGITGMIMFLAAFFSVFFRLFRSDDPFSRSAAIAFVIFFGHAVFENPLYSVHVLPALLLLLSLPRYER